MMRHSSKTLLSVLIFILMFLVSFVIIAKSSYFNTEESFAYPSPYETIIPRREPVASLSQKVYLPLVTIKHRFRLTLQLQHDQDIYGEVTILI